MNLCKKIITEISCWAELVFNIYNWNNVLNRVGAVVGYTHNLASAEVNHQIIDRHLCDNLVFWKVSEVWYWLVEITIDWTKSCHIKLVPYWCNINTFPHCNNIDIIYSEYYCKHYVGTVLTQVMYCIIVLVQYWSKSHTVLQCWCNIDIFYQVGLIYLSK